MTNETNVQPSWAARRLGIAFAAISADEQGEESISVPTLCTLHAIGMLLQAWALQHASKEEIAAAEAARDEAMQALGIGTPS